MIERLAIVLVCACSSHAADKPGDASAQGDDSQLIDAPHAGGLAAMPVISRGVPAFASSGTATDGNDDSYATAWRSSEQPSAATPSWLAYDLSGVAASQRHQVAVAMYSDNNGYSEYDLTAKPGTVAYNEARDFTIEGNAAPGGALPGSGWVVLATVTGNTYISRVDLVDLTGYSWLRFHVTAVNGTQFNLNAAANLDVHDASLGADDSWLMIGDSITAFAMRNDDAGIAAPSFAQLVHTAKPAYFPAEQGAGEGGWNSGTAFGIAAPDGNGTLFDYWLRTSPAHFVGLSFGTNDGADGSGDATPTHDHYVMMIEKVIAAGKVPCIPHVPWAEDAAHQTNAQLINAKIDALYVQYPTIVKGPDLYTTLQGRTDLFQDMLHPTPQGREVYRQAWATAVLSSVYP